MSAAGQAAAAARTFDQPAFISVFSDEQITRFPGVGPLAGMPFVVKDNIDVEGLPTTAANPAVTEPAPLSSFAVQQLVDAGAVPVGKTNLDQYATGLVGTRSPYGACHSVFSAVHVSGGSSSGTAVAVGAGVVPFGLATDTAGSGRVPAAFNGLVGLKGTRGLVSTTGVVPACRSLDCVTVMARSVSLVAQVFDVMGGFDPADPSARPAAARTFLPPVAEPVIGVPCIDLGLDPLHQLAWEQARKHAETLGSVVEVDVEAFLLAAELLYSGPWLAERSLAFGHLLKDEAGIDPTVRAIVSGGSAIRAEQAFAGMYRLAELRRRTEPVWDRIDTLLLPVTPTHPTLAEVAADPVGVNTRLGRFTNMTNLLDLAAIALPAGSRDDGLPFGVQLLAPALTDLRLIALGADWVGEARPAFGQPPVDVGGPERLLLAVAGAHLAGQPLNYELTERGARLVESTRTAAGYRMFDVPGPVPRPGLTRLPSGGLPSGRSAASSRNAASVSGIEVEVWSIPAQRLGDFVAGIAAPLAIGPLELADGREVLGFVCTADAVDPARDISGFGSWESYLASR